MKKSLSINRCLRSLYRFGRNKGLPMISLSSLLLAGCTYTYVGQLDPQSHYDYPNSNVYPLGHATGQASETSFFMPPTVTSALQYEAISKALEQQAGADLLVNSFHFVDITSLPILPIYTLTYRVEGTAAKMPEVGTKPLH